MAGSVARYFRFAERATDLATELRAGLTTFRVMAYIIFVNPIVLGGVGVPGFEGKGLPFAPTLTVTCLTAGVAITLLVLTRFREAVITNGIGAGFVTYAAIKLLNGKARQVHWVVYLASAAFVVYFGLPLIGRAMR